MRFERKIVGAEASIEDEAFVLPEDLAQLGALLGQQAQCLADTYPADPYLSNSKDADPVQPAYAEFADTDRPAGRTWPVLRRIAALLLVSLSVVWITRTNSPGRRDMPAASHPQPIAVQQTGLPGNDLGATRVRAIPFWLIHDSAPAPKTDWESPPKVGTGPESEGWLDLLEAQDPKQVSISM